MLGRALRILTVIVSESLADFTFFCNLTDMVSNFVMHEHWLESLTGFVVSDFVNY